MKIIAMKRVSLDQVKPVLLFIQVTDGSNQVLSQKLIISD